MREAEVGFVVDEPVCPYFVAGTVVVTLPTPLQSRTLPAPQCLLAEVMLARLRTSAAGQEVAALLSITPAGATPRSLYGPDLASPLREACSLARLQTGCVAGFVQRLMQQSLPADLPPPPLLAPET